MMLPIGPSGWQELVTISKDMDGNITKRKLLDVSFVPLVKSATNAH
jgi:protein-L-isoaspartate O-methyltransferase